MAADPRNTIEWGFPGCYLFCCCGADPRTPPYDKESELLPHEWELHSYIPASTRGAFFSTCCSWSSFPVASFFFFIRGESAELLFQVIPIHIFNSTFNPFLKGCSTATFGPKEHGLPRIGIIINKFAADPVFKNMINNWLQTLWEYVPGPHLHAVQALSRSPQLWTIYDRFLFHQKNRVPNGLMLHFRKIICRRISPTPLPGSGTRPLPGCLNDKHCKRGYHSFPFRQMYLTGQIPGNIHERKPKA